MRAMAGSESLEVASMKPPDDYVPRRAVAGRGLAPRLPRRRPASPSR